MKHMIISLSITIFIFTGAFSQIEIDSTGNVGVGTTTPTTKLDVNGVINATGGNSTEWKQQLTTNGDTIFISNGNYIVIPGLSKLNTSVQQRLDNGETPNFILGSGIPLDSLYGKTYQGGLIAYLNTTSGAGLIAASNDQSNFTEWGCNGTLISGADGVGIGTGAQNTVDIEAGCVTNGTAADICANLTLNSYSDWFLPSLAELSQLYLNLKLNGFGAFANNFYWSSTENDSNTAWAQDFGSGGQSSVLKNLTHYVRAVRAF